MTRSIRTVFFAVCVMTMSLAASAQIGISVSFGPPAIPVYEQPICPGDGYIWTPGYWAYDDDEADYYWVPGTWVESPEVGYLWTPPWWGWEGGAYLFHTGYWGPHIGFYGGINYGFGYFGEGFAGGRWQNDHFYYNREVTNVNVVNIHNVYNEHVTIVNNTHVSYNGGQGGIEARASARDEIAARDRHIERVAAQNQHIQAARGNRELRASVNQGRPAIAATARAGDFHSGAVPARQAGGEYHPPANRGAARPNENRPAENRPAENRPAENRAGNGNAGNMGARPESGAPRAAVHPHDLPAVNRPETPNSGNAKRDQKMQQQQDKLVQKQNQQREQLQQRQDQQHARLQQQHASEQRQQQVEQRHAQQTQQMQQRQQTQMQRVQPRPQPQPHQPEPHPQQPERK